MATRSKLEGLAYTPQAWEDVACPACGGVAYSLHERFGDRMQYSYQMCRACSLVVLTPRPVFDAAFVQEAYEDYVADDERYAIARLGHASLKKEVRLLEREVAALFPLAKRRGHLLDIGCKGGEFINAAKHHFTVVEGMEISPHLAAYATQATNCKIHLVNYEEFTGPLRYDVIRMSHVIEHIPTPRAWLLHTKTLLNPGGILVINVPNIRSLDRRAKLLLKRLGLRKGRWESWRTPDHLFEPSGTSFQWLLRDTGFKVIDMHTYSRRSMVPVGILGRFIHRRMLWGPNLRFYATPTG